MEVSASPCSLPVEVVTLIKEENKLYSKLEYLMKLKGSIGEKMMTLEPNEANIKKCLTQSKILDDEITPIAKKHQKVIDQLRTYSIVISHS